MEDLHALQREWEQGRRKILAASSANAMQKLPYLEKPCHGTMAVATTTSPPAFWHSLGNQAEGARRIPGRDSTGGSSSTILDSVPKVRKVSEFLLKYMCKYDPGGGK